MTKIIHIIMLGPKPTFSDNDMVNIESWKRNFPGWEIRIWTDENSMEWIRESSFASYWYDQQVYAYCSDYLRCRILYEYGGLYMDTDVYCANQIPEKYFEKSFTAWDVWGMPTTNNGTCFYASEPKLPLFKRFCDAMRDRSTKITPQENGAYAANCHIDEILKSLGLRTEETEYYEEDQDLGDIVVLNRSQFGAKYRDYEGYHTNGRKHYLVHQCSSSWVVASFSRYVNLYYAIIREESDTDKLISSLEKISKKFDSATVIIIFASCYFETPKRVLELIEARKSFTRVYLIPSPEKDNWKCALDFMFKRLADVKSCRNILRDV